MVATTTEQVCTAICMSGLCLTSFLQLTELQGTTVGKGQLPTI